MISVGKTEITATTEDGKFAAKCNVNVSAATISVTGVILNHKELTITEGNSVGLIAEVLPANATNKGIVWSSSNVNIAEVDSNGNIKGISEGNSEITVVTSDGSFKAVSKVFVTKAPISVTGINLESQTMTIAKGTSQYMYCSVIPANATNKRVIWSTSDTNIATIENDGKVTGISAGNAVITVKTEDGNFTSNCTVIIKDGVIGVDGIRLDSTSISINKGNEVGMGYSVLPLNATNRNVTWTSSNPNVVSIIYGNILKGISEGTSVITVRTEDGGYTASSTVTVNEIQIPVSAVKIDQQFINSYKNTPTK